jgi:hypothetical protein
MTTTTENGPSAEEMGLSAKDNASNAAEQIRQGMIDEVRTEAEIVNRRHGDQLKSFGTSARISELAGDSAQADEFRKQGEAFGTEKIDAQREKVDKILLAAARKNLKLMPIAVHPSDGSSTIDSYLKSAPELQVLDGVDYDRSGNFDMNDMERLAEKLGTQLQNLTERDSQGRTLDYAVVVLQDSQDSMTFITNETFGEGANHPRIFRLSKATMESEGYTLGEKTDFKSIYPEKPVTGPEQASAKAATA